MLKENCFSRDWIDRCGIKLGCRNPILLEKAITALQLVGHLVETGLPFQFKGGTSLLLVTSPIRRLSIDVDIVTQASPADLERALASVANLPPFIGIDHDPARDAALPPKRHYRAGYPSIFPPPQAHVLLDVLFEAAPKAVPTLIRTPFIETTRDVYVRMPDVNGLLGDKLTAFAPNTIGILQHPDHASDIVKQLFDVAVLFDSATDLSAAAAAYQAVHAQQCRYRKPYSLDETLDDTINTCVALGSNGLRGQPRNHTLADYLKGGVERLQNHIVNGRFSAVESQIATGKAASVAAWLKRRPEGVQIEALRYGPDQIAALADAKIEGDWTPLNRLRRGNPEAFSYWWRAQQLLRGG
jgi:hypothetical protein